MVMGNEWLDGRMVFYMIGDFLIVRWTVVCRGYDFKVLAFVVISGS